MTTYDISKSGWRTPNFTRALGIAGVASLLIFSVAGCKSSPSNATTTAAINNGTDTGGDPAADNLAPADNAAPADNTQVLGSNSSYTPQQQSESYQGQQAPAPVVQGYNDQDQGAEQAGEEAVDQTDQPPPPLPDYDQPPAPDPNYIWTPGYWAWGSGGYYWVPGAWVAPPYYGALWTPPYWGYDGGHYGFHTGYWGAHVGYYGGVDYGFGYIGIGYFGGYWQGNSFYYNRAVTNVGRGGNVYNRAVVYNNVHYGGQPSNRVSYNGGRGGINVRPRPSELAAGRESHTGALPQQRQNAQSSAHNKQQFFSANHGKPAEAASSHAVANPRGIAAPPSAVRQDQQHATQQRAADVQHGGAMQQQRGAPAAGRGNAPATEQQRGAMQQQHGAMQQQRGAPAAQRGNAPAPGQQHGAPAPGRMAPGAQQRGATPAQRNAPAAQRPAENRAAPAQRGAPAAQRPAPTRSAPVERAQPARAATPREAARPAPAPRAAAPRPAARPAPAPRAAAPRPAARPAPAPRAAAPRPAARPEQRH